MGEKARIEVERLNKEILLLGEANMKFQEKLEESEKTGLLDSHIEMLETSYKEEVNCNAIFFTFHFSSMP